MRSQHGHAGVVAQGPRELPPTDVDRVDVHRAGLEQAVGEAAGGGTGVEDAQAAGVDREPVEGGGELLASARHEAGRVAGDLDRLVGRDQAGRRGRRAAGDQHPPGGDGLDRLAAAPEQAPAHQLGVESPAHSHRCRVRVRCARGL